MAGVETTVNKGGRKGKAAKRDPATRIQATVNKGGSVTVGGKGTKAKKSK